MKFIKNLLINNHFITEVTLYYSLYWKEVINFAQLECKKLTFFQTEKTTPNLSKLKVVLYHLF